MPETSATNVVGARGTSLTSLFSRRLVRYAVAFAVYLLVTCAVFAPLISHPDSRVLVGFSDATLAIRAYDVMDAAGATPFTFRHDVLNGAPEGMPMLPQPAVAQPVQPAVIWALREILGTVAALNFFLLAGFVLTAIVGFALLDWAGFGMLPSLFCGFAMAFNPWMVERAISGHVAFIHGWTLILLLAALTKLRSVRTLRWAALAGLAYGWCFLVAAYMGLLATALVVAFVLVDLVAQVSGAERLWTCTLVVVLGGVTFLALVPGVVALARDSGTVTAGLSHDTEALQRFGARPAEYLLPVPRHPVLGALGGLRSGSDIFHERWVFVGYVILALASLTAVRLVRRSARLPDGAARGLVTLSAVAVPIAFVASMPRQLTVIGVGIPMPSYLIGDVTTFFRVYARFGYVVEIGLVVLAAAALHQMLLRSRRQLVLAVVLVGFAVFEFLPGTLSTIAIGKPPAYDTWLARQPAGIAAHYPMMTDQPQAEVLAAAELYYQRFTRQPLYEIYGTARSRTREDAIRLQSSYLDAPTTPGILAAEGVRYVVVHDDVFRAQGQAPPNLGEGVRLLKTFGPVRVFRLAATPIDLEAHLKEQATQIADQFALARPKVSFAGGFYPPEPYEGFATPFRWMWQSGQLDVSNYDSEPIRAWIEGNGFSNGVTRRLDLVDPAGRMIASVDVPGFMAPIRLGPFDLPRGTTRFTLEASYRPTSLGPGDPRVGSVFLSLRAGREPDLTRTLRKTG